MPGVKLIDEDCGPEGKEVLRFEKRESLGDEDGPEVGKNPGRLDRTESLESGLGELVQFIRVST